MAYALFITRNDIIKNSPLQGAIDADALLPFCRTAQDKYLKNLLGTVLFDYLQAQIVAGTFNSLSTYYQDLMDDYIKNALIWYACVEYIPFSSVQFKSNGAVKQQSETGVAPGKNEVDYLLNKALENPATTDNADAQITEDTSDVKVEEEKFSLPAHFEKEYEITKQ